MNEIDEEWKTIEEFPQKENELLRAKTEAIDSEKTREDLYRKAIAAMRSYTIPTEEEYEDPFMTFPLQ